MAVQAGNAGHCLEHGAAIWRAESELARVPGHVSAGEETENAAFVPSSVYTTAGKCPSKSPGHGFGLSRGHKGRNAAAPGRLRSAEHPRTAPGSRVRSHLGCCHRGVRALCARGRGQRGAAQGTVLVPVPILVTVPIPAPVPISAPVPVPIPAPVPITAPIPILVTIRSRSQSWSQSRSQLLSRWQLRFRSQLRSRCQLFPDPNPSANPYPSSTPGASSNLGAGPSCNPGSDPSPGVGASSAPDRAPGAPAARPARRGGEFPGQPRSWSRCAVPRLVPVPYSTLGNGIPVFLSPFGVCCPLTSPGVVIQPGRDPTQVLVSLSGAAGHCQ